MVGKNTTGRLREEQLDKQMPLKLSNSNLSVKVRYGTTKTQDIHVSLQLLGIHCFWLTRLLDDSNVNDSRREEQIRGKEPGKSFEISSHKIIWHEMFKIGSSSFFNDSQQNDFLLERRIVEIQPSIFEKKSAFKKDAGNFFAFESINEIFLGRK